MRQSSALLPQGAFEDRQVHGITVLICVEHLPEVVIRVAEAHTLAWLSDIVYVEVRESG